MIYTHRLLKSFRNACYGLSAVFREERNFRIHVVCAVIVLFAAVILQVTILEFIALAIVIVMLLVLEIINTALEKFQDIAKPRVHHYVGFIKDSMAGAVLLTAALAAGVTLAICVPKLIKIVSIFY